MAESRRWVRGGIRKTLNWPGSFRCEENVVPGGSSRYRTNECICYVQMN